MHYYNFICMLNRINTLGNYDFRSFGKKIFHSFTYFAIGCGINCACGVIKNKHLWFFENCSGSWFSETWGFSFYRSNSCFKSERCYFRKTNLLMNRVLMRRNLFYGMRSTLSERYRPLIGIMQGFLSYNPLILIYLLLPITIPPNVRSIVLH